MNGNCYDSITNWTILLQLYPSNLHAKQQLKDFNQHYIKYFPLMKCRLKALKI